MTKIISILSAGHSGSTLADILIGTIPGVFSTGECVYFPWQLYRNGGMCQLGQDVCSCGKQFSECKAWAKVVANLSKQVGFDIYKEPFRFPMAMYKNQRYDRPICLIDRVMRAVLIRLMQYYPSPPSLTTHLFYAYVKKQLTILRICKKTAHQ